MGNCFGQQQTDYQPLRWTTTQTSVYIHVTLQSKVQGTWNWNEMLQEISDVCNLNNITVSLCASVCTCLMGVVFKLLLT